MRPSPNSTKPPPWNRLLQENGHGSSFDGLQILAAGGHLAGSGTARLLRRHGTSAGKPCSSDADCRPAPGRCGKQGVCVDESVRCVRQHVVYVAGPCWNGDSPVNFSKWMRNDLYCEPEGCHNGVCMAPPNDNEWYPCYDGLPEPVEICVPEVPEFPEPPPSDPPAISFGFILEDAVRGWRSPRLPATPFATTDGTELDALTHTVLVGAGSPGNFGTEVAGPVLNTLAVALSGGGRWALPGNGQYPSDSQLLGPFAGHWADPLDELSAFIKQDRTSFVCAP